MVIGTLAFLIPMLRGKLSDDNIDRLFRCGPIMQAIGKVVWLLSLNEKDYLYAGDLSIFFRSELIKRYLCHKLLSVGLDVFGDYKLLKIFLLGASDKDVDGLFDMMEERSQERFTSANPDLTVVIFILNSIVGGSCCDEIYHNRHLCRAVVLIIQLLDWVTFDPSTIVALKSYLGVANLEMLNDL